MATKNKRKQKDSKEFDLSDYELTETDRKVFMFVQKYPNLKQKQVAQLLDLNEAYVSTLIHKPAYQLALAEYNKTWIQQILDAKGEAARTIVELLGSKFDNIRFSAAKEILQLDKTELGDGIREARSPY